MTDSHRRALDYMIEEKMVDIYYLLKEELEVQSNSRQEKILYEACEEFKKKIEELKSQVGYINDIRKYHK